MMSADNVQTPESTWEKKTVEKVLFTALKEQRRQRRWRIFFRFCWLFLILFILFVVFTNRSDDYYDRAKPHTGVVHIDGEIADGGKANAEDINKGIDDALDDPNTKAVMLLIDSPGGSPVQANQVYQHLVIQRQKHPKIKFYAVCTDMCASGAYYMAAGADYIYADQASLVGSIGVLMNGFGFVDTLQKVGAQRRLLTAGSEKGFLDPFSPEKPQDLAYMQTMLDTIHQQFIDAVKNGRGKRLSQDPMLFTGLVWTGQQALPLGLVDGLGTPEQIAKTVIKYPTVVDYSVGDNFFNNFAQQVGSSAAGSSASLLGIQRGLLH